MSTLPLREITQAVPRPDWQLAIQGWGLRISTRKDTSRRAEGAAGLF